ncbi:hypothetical protein BGX31_007822, partial [Mortierella sp. GBA43]
ILALLISLGCITVMSVLFGRKTAGTKLSRINYARGLVIALYLVSWMFSLIATHLTQTNNYNVVSCTMSIYSCILLYAFSKIIIYLFLMEKVYVVTGVGLTRKSFQLYKVNLGLMVPFIGIVVLMIYYRIAAVNDDGECRIGLPLVASLPLILYDMFLSSWLTLLFIRPLMDSRSMLQGPSKGRLRQVARRTFIGAVIALLLSAANIFTLVYFQGNERGLICLSSCTADVTLNAITIHWVTSRAAGKSNVEVGIGLPGPGSAGYPIKFSRGNDPNGNGTKRADGTEGRRGWYSVWGELDEIGLSGAHFIVDRLPAAPQRHKMSFDSHITVEAYWDEQHYRSQLEHVHQQPQQLQPPPAHHHQQQQQQLQLQLQQQQQNAPSYPSPILAESKSRRASFF